MAESARWIAPDSDHKHKLEIARQRIKTHPKCLIIFDNIESASQLKEYLPDLQTQSHVIVTSRFEQPGFSPIPLDILDRTDSKRLLIQEAGLAPKGDEETSALSEIAGTFQGLPLALELAGAYIRHRGITWCQYRDLLRLSVRTALPGKFLKGSFTKHESDLYSTLVIDEGLFDDEPRLQELLDLLSWSGSAPMGESLLCHLMKVESIAELTGALGLGTSLRLLQLVPGRGYALHRLVSEVRRESRHLDSFGEWPSQICELIGDWFQERRQSFSALHEYEAEIDHLSAWQRHAEIYAPKQACRLTWLQGYPPYFRGRYQEAKSWVEKAKVTLDRSSTENLLLRAHLLNDLGCINNKLGNYKEAFALVTQSVENFYKIYGDIPHPDTALALNNAGCFAGSRVGATLETAQKYLDQSLNMRQAYFKKPDVTIAHSLVSLGGLYREFGEFDKSISHLNQAIELFVALFGDEYVEVARGYSSLADTHLKRNDIEAALMCSARAYKIWVATMGEMHPETAEHLIAMGVCHSRKSDFKKTLELAQKALWINRKLLGDTHPSTVNSAVGVIIALDRVGRTQQAAVLVKEFLNKCDASHPLYSRLISLNERLRRVRIPGFRNAAAGKKKR